MSKSPVNYERHRFPPAVIAPMVWLYFRFSLSLRLVGDAAGTGHHSFLRDDPVLGEEVRSDNDSRLRRKAPNPKRLAASGRGGGDDRRAQALALARAVDQDRYVLDEIVQTRRNTKAPAYPADEQAGMPAKRVVTDKLLSYGAARRQIIPAVQNRLEQPRRNAHLPLRKRERAMQRFRSPGALQRFTSVFSRVQNRFVPIASEPWHIGRRSLGRRPNPTSLPIKLT